MGDYLLAGLRRLHSPLIREVRGKGLWCGIDFDPARISAREVAERLLQAGILTKDTHGTVIRLAPPLVVDIATLDWALDTVQRVLDNLERSQAPTLAAVHA
jgi:ornithine--oxo-acid transaminase